MKKILCSLLLIGVVFSVMMGSSAKISAGGDMGNMGTLFINGVKVENRDTVIKSDDQLLFPLRTILEELGSMVMWESSTGNAYFDFAGVVYVCKLNAFPQRIDAILVCKVTNINSTNNADYIQLHQMSADGTYCSINGRIYLYQQTGQRLFEALGCKAEIDLNQGILKISN